MKIIAHRGASGEPGVENTLETFKKAMELDIDMVEFDVRKTKDNVLIVYHDKVFADQPVSWYTYEEMERVAKQKGFHIPMFVEVLELCAGKVFMDIEVKEPGFEHRIVRLLHKYADYNDYSVKSFEDCIPYRIKEFDSMITTGLLLGYSHASIKRRLNEIFPIRRLKACKADFVSPQYWLMRFNFIERLQKKGYPVYVWTVNTPALIEKVMKRGAAGVITDNPKLAIQIRRNAGDKR